MDINNNYSSNLINTYRVVKNIPEGGLVAGNMYTVNNDMEIQSFTAADYIPWNSSSITISSCPSLQEIMNYLAAGVYWDNGSSNYSPTYKVDNKIYKTGLWMKKGANSDNAGSILNTTPKQATDEIRTSGDYFFLPAAGYFYSNDYKEEGDQGHYWSNTKTDNATSWKLMFNDKLAQVSTNVNTSRIPSWTAE